MRTGFASLAVCLLVLAGFGAGAPARAQPPLDEIAACAEIAEDEERLACYDAVAAELTGEGGEAPGAAAKRGAEANRRSAPRAAGRADTPEPGKRGGGEAPGKRGSEQTHGERAASKEGADKTEKAETEDDRFGLPPEGDEEEEDDDTRRMTVAETQETRRLDRLVLTMENGQVWRQTEDQSLPPVEPGMEVTIEEGIFGGFSLSVSGRTIRVERVR